MRRLLAEPMTMTSPLACHAARRSAGSDGDPAAVAELRAAAPRATVLERSMLDALFADAALTSGHTREAIETARRVVRRDGHGAARHLAAALLVLGGLATRC